jgi:hypothetical protein
MISFVVPVRDDAARLARCLASIRAAAGDGAAELVVVDNGSSDGSADVAAAAGAVVLSRPALGVSTLRNLGAAAAKGDLLAFVDADHELDPGWLEAARSVLADPTVAAAGAQYRAPSPGTWVQRCYDRLRKRQPECHDVDWLPSGNLVVRRTWFNSVGGFDTGLDTCEDVDFCRRLRASGGRVVADERIGSVHLGDPATLRALFLGELWRGRDSLRVSLRGPLTPRTMMGLAPPVGILLALPAAAAGLATGAPTGRVVAGAASAVVLLFVSLRAAMLIGRGPRRQTVADLAQAWIVAAVYDLARAFALVARGGHRTRRSG